MSRPKVRIKVLAGFNCNQNCIYCDNPKDEKVDFDNFEAIRTTIDYLKDDYDILIEMDGGESLSYSSLLQELLSYHLPIYIFSNGTMIDESILSILHNKVTFRISLDGVEALHITQRPLKNGENSFQKTLTGIKILQQNQIPFIIASTITDLSIAYLNRSKDLILNLNPKRWILTTQMFKDKDLRKTAQIFEKALPIISSWNDNRVSFHSFHLQQDVNEIGQDKEILFKAHKIQINIEGFGTPTLKEYSYNELPQLLKDMQIFLQEEMPYAEL